MYYLKTVDSIYSQIKTGKYVNDFHLDQTLEYYIDKTQEYLFTNIDQQFWNNEEFSKISKVLMAEVKNDFEAATLQIRRIESIGKLLSLLNPEKLRKMNSESKPYLMISIALILQLM